MKKEIAAYVAKCDTCCRVKAIHLKPAGLLQPLSILGWKWEEISMDFIVGLPPTKKGYNSIWVIVDRLTKSAHFIPVRSTYRPSDNVELYFSQIVKLHGVPRTIVSDRGAQFTARFWEHLHSLLGTKLVHSSAYHPQTSSQTERVNQILDDMLRACVSLPRVHGRSGYPLVNSLTIIAIKRVFKWLLSKLHMAVNVELL